MIEVALRPLEALPIRTRHISLDLAHRLFRRYFDQHARNRAYAQNNAHDPDYCFDLIAFLVVSDQQPREQGTEIGKGDDRDCS